ncbi:helix-turn-helix transcriptional regulator, partial [Rhodococcus sp. NPDC059969]|uniref:helix-turn-helix transcriptional regulator n=1 Tax=Rhodococcus sp. NPDC059969 TaxID=3347018 RepID=UPI00366A73F7
MSKKSAEEGDMFHEAIVAKIREIEGEPKPAADGLPVPAERAQIRKAAKWKQTDVAELIGVHRLTVSAWERGESEPTGEARSKYVP